MPVTAPGRACGPPPIWRHLAYGRTRHAAPCILSTDSLDAILTGTSAPQLDLNNDLDIRGPSVHTQARTWVTDYLIGCHASDDSVLNVLVGSNEYVSFRHSLFCSHSCARGDIALLRNADFHDRTSPWSLERLWTGHHKGVVRSSLLVERVSGTLLLVFTCSRYTRFYRGPG